MTDDASGALAAWVMKVLGVDVSRPAAGQARGEVSPLLSGLDSAVETWAKLRAQAFSELSRLKDAIAAEFADIEQMQPQVQAALQRLDQSFGRLDGSVERELAGVLKESDPAQRRSLAGAASASVQVLRSYVETDVVLAEVDGNEVLPDMRVVEPLRATLAQIAAILGG